MGPQRTGEGKIVYAIVWILLAVLHKWVEENASKFSAGERKKNIGQSSSILTRTILPEIEIKMLPSTG